MDWSDFEFEDKYDLETSLEVLSWYEDYFVFKPRTIQERFILEGLQKLFKKLPDQELLDKLEKIIDNAYLT